LDRLDQFRETEVNFTHGAGSRFVSPIRRNLAIVDQSPLRRECLKLALLQQPRRWHVSDFETAIELAQLIRRGEGFEVILLGGSTCAHIDLADLALLSAAAPETPILVTADCDDTESARMILRSGARGFLPTSLGLKVLMGALEDARRRYLCATVIDRVAAPECGGVGAGHTLARADETAARCPGIDLGRQVQQAYRRRVDHD